MKLSYRPEIDGLRTIAVLSVILYHAQIVILGHDVFKGGFVGVDIFFIISGYLISRILLSELFEKGKISFLQFYERRARRILPILFIVFLVSFPLAYKYLMPHQFVEYAKSILSATFFGSNIFFYFTNTQYGAEDSLLQPFLHTWSLGVEEQFYILFPIVLLLGYKFAKNHLITIIVVLILISLTYANWQSTQNTQLNFFMLTSRLWELGIGSLLAFYELKYGKVKSELLNQTMPLLGLIMIAYSIVFFNNQTPHPSVITLLPTLGTALVILYSVNKTDLVGKVLSWKPIVGVGLISYSMYLWHYPIFAFVRLADSNVSDDEKYLLLLLTISLSIFSYFLIEKPFRNKQYFNFKSFIIILLIIFIAIVMKNLYVINSDGISSRFDKFSFTKEYNWNYDELHKLRNSVKINSEFKSNDLKKILVIGNSHAKDLINSIQLNEKLNSIISSNVYITQIIELVNIENFTHFINNKSFIEADFIFLSTQYIDGDIEALDDLIPLIQKNNKKIVLFGNNAEFKKNRGNQIALTDILLLDSNKSNFKNQNDFKKYMDSYHFKSLKQSVIEKNKKIQLIAKNHNILFIDKVALVCNSKLKTCDSLTNDFKKTYIDSNHWTIEGAKFFGNKLSENDFLELIDSLNKN
jgi:peptidoglycan/LPS O-acetylase OafA/YrhL